MEVHLGGGDTDTQGRMIALRIKNDTWYPGIDMIKNVGGAVVLM